MDIIYIERKPILHIVDEGTRFSAARFLPNPSTEAVWQTFLTCWASIYTGLPQKILVDQGSQFGKILKTLGALRHIEIEETGTEAHSSLGLGERYHEPVRTTYRKLRLQFPKVDPEVLLRFSVKAMNDTLGPEGLFPSALVFGEYPSIRTVSELLEERPTLSSRAELAIAARKEMAQIMAKQRVQRGLRHNVPAATDRAFAPGDKVLVWRENIIANRIGEWMGPFIVEAVDVGKKLVYVRDAKVGPAKPYNLAQVKPFIPPEYAAKLLFADVKEAFHDFLSPEGEEEILLTEVVEAGDSRIDTPEMAEARYKEIKGLLERGTFQIILREEVPPGSNLMPARFVFAIKSTEDRKIKFKARYVICGNRDRMKNMMVHSTITVQASSTRIALALASIFGFDVWSADVT